ncbi:Fur family transcriptional regulator [Paenibacillus macerans]|uniref:Fur family transcriptional regulator n=1 Tax=Paenibacillus macerans TaxID=44252 RepID=UPI00203D5E62|nr:Fur family transcriptional regulator [Paenibacillus macerans]MCM3701647.1 transcriptional repressor [Paenibacillus macerans]
MENRRESMVRGMEARGLRITVQRRLIAELFSVSSGFVLPRQVHSYISNQIPGVSYDTVYRNLRLLVRLNLIEQFDFPDGVRFKLRCGPDHHHHHFICMKCHKTYPLDFCPIDNGIDPPEAFEVISHKFEVYGLCGDCRRNTKEE